MGLEIEPWEPEESVGLIWHRWASGFDAPADFQDQAVALSRISGRLAVLFRGLGGDPAVEIRAADDQVSHHRLGWRRRLGTAAESVPRASFDGAILRLPQRLSVLPLQQANAALYLWLAASAAHGRPAARHDDPLRADLARLSAVRDAVARTLADAPGLTALYRDLCRLTLPLRAVPRLTGDEAAVEAIIRHMLGCEAPLTARAHAMLAGSGRTDRFARLSADAAGRAVARFHPAGPRRWGRGRA